MVSVSFKCKQCKTRVILDMKEIGKFNVVDKGDVICIDKYVPKHLSAESIWLGAKAFDKIAREFRALKDVTIKSFTCPICKVVHLFERMPKLSEIVKTKSFKEIVKKKKAVKKNGKRKYTKRKNKV